MYPETTKKKNENNKIDNPNAKWGQDLNRQHNKEGKGIRVVIKYRKDVQHHLSLEKCKLKP